MTTPYLHSEIIAVSTGSRARTINGKVRALKSDPYGLRTLFTIAQRRRSNDPRPDIPRWQFPARRDYRRGAYYTALAAPHMEQLWALDACEEAYDEAGAMMRHALQPYIESVVDVRALILSRRATIVYGSGGQLGCTYEYHGFRRVLRRWRDAGWRLERKDDEYEVVIENYRGREQRRFVVSRKFVSENIAARTLPAEKWKPEMYSSLSWSQELSRQLISAHGWGKISQALGATTIRTEGNMELARIPADRLGERYGADAIILRVQCPSTGAYYALRVPPDYADRSCEEARRWTMDIPVDADIISEA